MNAQTLSLASIACCCTLILGGCPDVKPVQDQAADPPPSLPGAPPPAPSTATGAPGASSTQPRTSDPHTNVIVPPGTAQPSEWKPHDNPAEAVFLGLAAPKPVSWTEQSPSTASRMRAAQYAVPGQGTGDHATLIVYYFGNTGGGTKELNIQRWIGQFSPPGKEPAVPKTEEFEADGMPVTLVELAGEYQAMGAASFASDSLFFSAIVEAPVGMLFIQLVGKTETVEANREAYMKFIRGLHKKEQP